MVLSENLRSMGITKVVWSYWVDSLGIGCIDVVFSPMLDGTAWYVRKPIGETSSVQEVIQDLTRYIRNWKPFIGPIQVLNQ